MPQLPFGNAHRRRKPSPFYGLDDDLPLLGKLRFVLLLPFRSYSAHILRTIHSDARDGIPVRDCSTLEEAHPPLNPLRSLYL